MQGTDSYRRGSMANVGTFVQFNQNEVEVEDVLKEVKRVWKDEHGGLIKNINDLRVYIKPEESMCYYIINDEVKGKISL